MAVCGPASSEAEHSTVGDVVLQASEMHHAAAMLLQAASRGMQVRRAKAAALEGIDSEHQQKMRPLQLIDRVLIRAPTVSHQSHQTARTARTDRRLNRRVAPDHIARRYWSGVAAVLAAQA